MVPPALLDFSAGVLRERFSAGIRKPVFTFSFDRYNTVTPQLLCKLQNVLGDLHDIALAAHGHAHSHAHTGAPAETPPLPPFATALPAGDAAALSAALAAHSAALTAQTPQLRHRAAKLLALNANTPHWWQD